MGKLWPKCSCKESIISLKPNYNESLSNIFTNDAVSCHNFLNREKIKTFLNNLLRIYYMNQYRLFKKNQVQFLSSAQKS